MDGSDDLFTSPVVDARTLLVSQARRLDGRFPRAEYASSGLIQIARHGLHSQFASGAVQSADVGQHAATSPTPAELFEAPDLRCLDLAPGIFGKGPAQPELVLVLVDGMNA